MKIVERLAQQDEILEQIAWIKAIISQRPKESGESSKAMEDFLDSMSDYAESACGDSVSDDAAEAMHRLSLESAARPDHASTRTSMGLHEPSLFVAEHGPEPMTIVFGNNHRLVEPETDRPGNKHLWSFFVHLSGEEIVDRVTIYLHRTFRQSELTFTHSPYRTTRIGWGYFEIKIRVMLKSGYRWQQTGSRALDLFWDLDFDGVGDSVNETHSILVDNPQLNPQ